MAPGEFVVTAFNEFINIPVRMTNAFLNGGQYLDLTGIVNAINPLPPDISKIGVELGGLLNLVPQDGTLAPPGPAPTVYGGGVGFDGLAIDATLGDLTASVPGLPIGLTGASLGLNRYTAQQILVTPPLKSQTAAAVEVAPVEAAAPIAEAPAVEVVADAPAPVEVPAEESAVAVEELGAVVDDPAPAVEDIAEIEAAVEAIEASEAEPVEAPAAVAEDSGPEAAAGADEQSDGDTGRAARSTQRG